MQRFFLFAISSILLLFQSCQTPGCTDPTACNYDPNATVNNNSCDYSCFNNCTGGPITVSGHITTNETWSPPCVYYLDGEVVVDPGVTLTIEPGTLIKGMQGTGANIAILIVEKGAKIYANGTAAEPIIFTSELDNIATGQLTGTNLNETDVNLWGGVAILGNAPVSDYTNDTYGLLFGSSHSYGGNVPNDNSGSLNYVSIRHGGAMIAPGNEINALTLGGVGSGTTINNIELAVNMDDGIEIFGGTVSITNLISGFHGDDGIDIDQNYAGTISNFIVFNGANSDEHIEVDGPEGLTNTTGMFTLIDGTCTTQNGVPSRTSDFKSSAQGTVSNIIFDTDIKIRSSYVNCSSIAPDAFANLTNGSPTLTFSNVQYTTLIVYTASVQSGTQIACSVPPSDQNAAQNAVPSTSATGASTTGWDWTWVHLNGFL